MFAKMEETFFLNFQLSIISLMIKCWKKYFLWRTLCFLSNIFAAHVPFWLFNLLILFTKVVREDDRLATETKNHSTFLCGWELYHFKMANWGDIKSFRPQTSSFFFLQVRSWMTTHPHTEESSCWGVRGIFYLKLRLLHFWLFHLFMHI